MFNPNLAKIFQQKHVTVIICYDRDCQKNLYDNLYCDLNDEAIKFCEIALEPADADRTKQVYDLTVNIANAFAKTNLTDKPIQLLIDLEKVQSYYSQLGHYQEFCEQLVKINDFSQLHNVGIVMLMTVNEPWIAATTANSYLEQFAKEQITSFTVFAMTDKKPDQLTFASGPQTEAKLDLYAFSNQ